MKLYIFTFGLDGYLPVFADSQETAQRLANEAWHGRPEFYGVFEIREGVVDVLSN